jgi:hypothetical protein
MTQLSPAHYIWHRRGAKVSKQVLTSGIQSLHVSLFFVIATVISHLCSPGWVVGDSAAGGQHDSLLWQVIFLIKRRDGGLFSHTWAEASFAWILLLELLSFTFKGWLFHHLKKKN